MQTKHCPQCSEVKSVADFYKNRASSDGLVWCCKVCAAAYAKKRYNTTEFQEKRAGYLAENRAKIAEQAKARYWRNPERARATSKRTQQKRAAAVAEYMREWRANNREKIAADFRAWSKANPERVAAKSMKRYIKLRTAIPPWVDQDALLAIYTERKRISEETGIVHHVDHIVPIIHPRVCGLHVPWNLQVIPAKENQAKGNRRFDAA